jgi:hypothetical protein
MRDEHKDSYSIIPRGMVETRIGNVDGYKLIIYYQCNLKSLKLGMESVPKVVLLLLLRLFMMTMT